MTEIGCDLVGRRYFVALFRPGCLTELPWGSETFDCVVFLLDADVSHLLVGALSSELAQSRVDWVQVAGRGAEELHDAIDRASVAAGRQMAAGDGSPMTSWHEEAESLGAMTEIAWVCFGDQDWVLVLVVGQDTDFSASVEAMQRGRTIRCT
jgi:hypothetical protein